MQKKCPLYRDVCFIQWNLYKPGTICAKKCLLYRDVRFIEIFSKTVWQQRKSIRSSSYCPSYKGILFIVCLLYRDSTLTHENHQVRGSIDRKKYVKKVQEKTSALSFTFFASVDDVLKKICLISSRKFSQNCLERSC